MLAVNESVTAAEAKKVIWKASRKKKLMPM
jgi:hypothetical protein